MASVYPLLCELQKLLQVSFKGFRFDTSDGRVMSEPEICIGRNPPKQSDGGGGIGNPPLVIVRSLEGRKYYDESRARVHEVKIGFLCGVYSKDSLTEHGSGYGDILSMMERVLVFLDGLHLVCDNQWEVKEPFEWTSGLGREEGVYDAGGQGHPFYYASVVATFRSFAGVPKSQNTLKDTFYRKGV